MGEDQSLLQLLARYRPAVLALTLDRVGDVGTARDLTQDVMEQAVRHIGDLRDPAALPAWLRAIALNRSRLHFRRPRESAAGLVVPETRAAESTYRVAVRRMMLRDVLAALRELPENNRLALLMHVLHGLPYRRIADFLGVPVSTVESRIHRARRELRREAEKWLLDATAEDNEEASG